MKSSALWIPLALLTLGCSQGPKIAGGDLAGLGGSGNEPHADDDEDAADDPGGSSEGGEPEPDPEPQTSGSGNDTDVEPDPDPEPMPDPPSGATTTGAESGSSTGDGASTGDWTSTGDGTSTGALDNCCCEPTPGQVGCEDPAVEACVCAFDSYCCDVEWDDVCVQESIDASCHVCP